MGGPGLRHAKDPFVERIALPPHIRSSKPRERSAARGQPESRESAAPTFAQTSSHQDARGCISRRWRRVAAPAAGSASTSDGTGAAEQLAAQLEASASSLQPLPAVPAPGCSPVEPGAEARMRSRSTIRPNRENESRRFSCTAWSSEMLCTRDSHRRFPVSGSSARGAAQKASGSSWKGLWCLERPQWTSTRKGAVMPQEQVEVASWR